MTGSSLVQKIIFYEEQKAQKQAYKINLKHRNETHLPPEMNFFCYT